MTDSGAAVHPSILAFWGFETAYIINMEGPIIPEVLSADSYDTKMAKPG